MPPPCCTCATAVKLVQEMLQRSRQHGVAPISWQELEGQLIAFSHGEWVYCGCSSAEALAGLAVERAAAQSLV